MKLVCSIIPILLADKEIHIMVLQLTDASSLSQQKSFQLCFNMEICLIYVFTHFWRHDLLFPEAKPLSGHLFNGSSCPEEMLLNYTLLPFDIKETWMTFWVTGRNWFRSFSRSKWIMQLFNFFFFPKCLQLL